MTAILIEPHIEIKPGPYVTKRLTVFYFGGDDGRMGCRTAQAIGVDDDGEFWLAHINPALVNGTINIERGIADFSLFDFIHFGSEYREENHFPHRLLMDGRKASDWNRREFCDSGGGTWGICFGQMDVRTRTLEWLRAKVHVKTMFSELLQESAEVFSADETKEVSSFIEVGEFGLALETYVDIFSEEDKSPSVVIIQKVEQLAIAMSMDAHSVLARLCTTRNHD